MDPSVKMYEWIASNKALGWNGGQTRLRFDDDSAINVNVHLLDDCSEFQLTEYTDLA